VEVQYCLAFNRERAAATASMDEVEFRRLLDLFPIVRARDYHVTLPLFTNFCFFFFRFPLFIFRITSLKFVGVQEMCLIFDPEGFLVVLMPLCVRGLFISCLSV
jgi:hypothetical protein